MTTDPATIRTLDEYWAATCGTGAITHEEQR